MNTKTIILGVVVAALSLFTLNASAQAPDLAPAKVVSAKNDMIKLIYSHPAESSVEVKFLDSDGLIKRERIKAQSFEKGFAKTYKVERLSDDDFWVEIKSQDMTVTYKMTSTQKGIWSAELEKSTYHPVVASR